MRENIHYARETNLISSWDLIKAFYLPSKTNKEKKFKTRFCRRKTDGNDKVKINLFPNIPCTFLFFKASVFLQILLPDKRVLGFTLLDKWGVNNSIGKVNVYFSIVFYDEDYILQYKRKKDCVATNFIIISKDK